MCSNADDSGGELAVEPRQGSTLADNQVARGSRDGEASVKGQHGKGVAARARQTQGNSSAEQVSASKAGDATSWHVSAVAKDADHTNSDAEAADQAKDNATGDTASGLRWNADFSESFRIATALGGVEAKAEPTTQLFDIGDDTDQVVAGPFPVQVTCCENMCVKGWCFSHGGPWACQDRPPRRLFEAGGDAAVWWDNHVLEKFGFKVKEKAKVDMDGLESSKGSDVIGVEQSGSDGARRAFVPGPVAVPTPMQAAEDHVNELEGEDDTSSTLEDSDDGDDSSKASDVHGVVQSGSDGARRAFVPGPVAVPTLAQVPVAMPVEATTGGQGDEGTSNGGVPEARKQVPVPSVKQTVKEVDEMPQTQELEHVVPDPQTQLFEIRKDIYARSFQLAPAVAQGTGQIEGGPAPRDKMPPDTVAVEVPAINVVKPEVVKQVPVPSEKQGGPVTPGEQHFLTVMRERIKAMCDKLAEESDPEEAERLRGFLWRTAVHEAAQCQDG